MTGADEQASRHESRPDAVGGSVQRISDCASCEVPSPEPREQASALEAHSRRAALWCELTRSLERGEASLGVADQALKVSREEQRLESHLFGLESRDLFECRAGLPACGQQPGIDALEQPVATRFGAMSREELGGLLLVSARQGGSGESDIAQDAIGQRGAFSQRNPRLACARSSTTPDRTSPAL